tara:strand:+ start:391 stop:1266 length:876 start_codon:yes stop_codon:yes gene_type:complete
MLTVVIPSFHSSELVEERLSEIKNEIPVIIVENSRNFSFKEKIENKHKNTQVIIPSENLGFGTAFNVGIKASQTKMVFLMQPDLKLIDNCIDKLIECTKNFKDFSILTPNDVGKKHFINYEIYKKYPALTSENKFLLEEVDYVDLSWLVNKDNFDENDMWDEKIFLYFEANDFAKRLKDRNKKIFVAKGINTYHIGSSSHDKSLEHYSLLNRNWHYNWSRFYYLKKHYGKFFAFKKGFSTFIKILIKLTKAIIFFKKIKKKYIYTELSGLFSSMINKKSYYRPYESMNNKK